MLCRARTKAGSPLRSARQQRDLCILATAFLLAFAAGVPQSAAAQHTRGINVDKSAVWLTENGGTYTQEVWLAGHD